MSRGFWRGRRVFVTGHTGFKGGWLSLWLADMGAEVHGYALPPPTKHSFYTETGLSGRIASETIADLRAAGQLASAMSRAKPEVVFHLAAQPLVRYSYEAPLETFEVNVIGTANLLEMARRVEDVRAVVVITTDKCYENRDWVWPYRENDQLGGYDPYSSSKACAELVTATYRRSFFDAVGIGLATARAGNVIGGGDWATDRLLPDFLRAMDAGETLAIRSPSATRPWQHVLEPLAGYLMLAEKLYANGTAFAEAWNFGPREEDARSVQWIVESLCRRFERASYQIEGAPQPHEAATLRLDSSKAGTRLDWHPRWSLETALSQTLQWHQAWRQGHDMIDVSLKQIYGYEASAT
jgi:CDP-glucose 4,6-dehydratase